MEAVTGYRVKSVFELDNKPYISSLKDVKTQVNTTVNSITSKVRESSGLIKTALGIVGFVGIVNEFKKIDTAATEQRLAFKGLASSANAYGRDIKMVNGIAKDLASDGLLKTKQAAEGLKFLMATGFNEKEAFDMSAAIKDIGAFNNVVGDLGQSFVDTTKGLKTGSIELIENSGFTQRISNVLKAANVEFKNGIDLTNNAAQRTAVYNAFMKERIKFEGDAARLANDAYGKQKILENRITNVRAQLGEGLLPVKNEVLDFLVSGFEKMSDIVDRIDFGKVFSEDKLGQIKNITMGVIGVAAGFALVAGAVTLISSPIGLVIAGASLLYQAYKDNIFGIKSLFDGLYNIMNGIYGGMIRIKNKAAEVVYAAEIKLNEGNIKGLEAQLKNLQNGGKYGINETYVQKLMLQSNFDPENAKYIKDSLKIYFNPNGIHRDSLDVDTSMQVLKLLIDGEKKGIDFIKGAKEKIENLDGKPIDIKEDIANGFKAAGEWGAKLVEYTGEGAASVLADVGKNVRHMVGNVYNNFMKNPRINKVEDYGSDKQAKRGVNNPIIEDEKKKEKPSEFMQMLKDGYKPPYIESAKNFGKAGGEIEFSKNSSEDFTSKKDSIINRIKSFESLDSLTKNVLSLFGKKSESIINPSLSVNEDGTYGKEHIKDYSEAYDKALNSNLEKVSNYVNNVSDLIANSLINGFSKGSENAKKYLDSNLVNYTVGLGSAAVTGVKEMATGDMIGGAITIGAAALSPFIEGLTENLLIPLAFAISPFFNEIAPLMQSIAPIFSSLINGLRPSFAGLGVALQILNPIVQVIGKGMTLFYDYGIRPVTNLIIGIVRGLGQMFQGLASVKIFGWHPFGFLGQVGNSLAGVDYLKKSDEYTYPSSSEDKGQESQYNATSVSTINNYNTIQFTGTINSLGKDSKVMKEIADSVFAIFVEDLKIDLVGGKS